MTRKGGRPWRRLKDQVVAEEPLCTLRLEPCTGVSTTADHIIPVSLRPDLEYLRSNLRGSCEPCNRLKADRIHVPPVKPSPWASRIPVPPLHLIPYTGYYRDEAGAYWSRQDGEPRRTTLPW